MDKTLNKSQQEAVEHGSGPLLIIAGAGTGKTTVITERIKYLIGTGLAKPEEILTLTFTEKAAREMEERVDIALPYGTFGIWIMTFHSFCDRILRNEALHLGLSSNYQLMTETESYLFVKRYFWKFNLTYFRPQGNPYKFIEGMLQHFSRLKDEDVLPDNYQNDEYPELVEAYRIYEELKVKEGVMDFADLIANTLKLFRTRPLVLEKYQKQFRYILLDEFQDTNYAQYQLVKLLCADDSDVTVVADDDQSIYRFRGAAIANVLQFKKDYPQAKVITLTKNYRSTQEILDRAYELIQHNNPDRLEVAEGIDKKLISATNDPGEKLEFAYFSRGEEESDWVAKKIKDLSSRYEYKDLAILVRANNYSEPFVEALERMGIPYQFLGPGQLFRQPEVRDLIAYLKFLTDFTDNVSFYRVLSMEIFTIKQREIIGWLAEAKKENLSLFEVLERKLEPEKIKKVVAMIHRHQEMISKQPAGQILYSFLEDSGLLKRVVDYKTITEERQSQNIIKFFDKMKNFPHDDVFSVVEYLNLAMDQGESPLAAETDWTKNNAVNILTLHSAKGLEFPVVFLVNLVDGRFPSRERKEQIPIPDKVIKEILPVGDFHLEEERRLFYVGLTRAREKLFLTAAGFYKEGKRERKISPFVRETLGEFPVKKISSLEEKQIPLFEWEGGKTVVGEEKPSVSIDYLSYSAIETFRLCPLHFKMKNILRLPTPPNAAQSMGNSMHLTLRDLYLHPELEPETILRRDWISEGYQSKKHENDAFEKIKKFLQDYLRTDLHQNAKPVYLEQPFTFKIDDTLKIGGKFDRIDDFGEGNIEIVDYKTGANVPTKKEIDADLQMSIYALAAVEVLQTSIEKIKLSFYYFDTGTKITTTRTVEQLGEVRKELLAVRDEIQRSDFRCSGSVICQNCEFKILCN